MLVLWRKRLRCHCGTFFPIKKALGSRESRISETQKSSRDEIQSLVEEQVILVENHSKYLSKILSQPKPKENWLDGAYDCI